MFLVVLILMNNISYGVSLKIKMIKEIILIILLFNTILVKGQSSKDKIKN